MANNTQRLLLILLFINLFLSIAVGVYNTPTQIDSGVFDEITNVGENKSKEFMNSPGESVVPLEVQEQVTYGNPVKAGRVIFNVFVQGLKPLPITSDQYDSGLTQIVVIIIIVFRAMLALVAIIHLMKFIFHKMSS